MSAGDIEPTIEAPLNPASPAIVNQPPKSDEIISNPVSLLSASDIETSVETLSNPPVTTSSKTDVVNSGLSKALPALSNQSPIDSNVIPTIDPIIADSEGQNPENSILEEINSISEFSNEENSILEQVTSVSQLSDVQPTDWAFQALQSLVERYGCIAGYPDGTYRGNRAMTRYEFAAGLNACLERINEIISSNTNNLATKEDLITLQRLQEEFAAELATLRGRVDVLEARTAELEANQFSTTAKLLGNVTSYIGDAFGENAGPANSATFNAQVNLVLLTSFSGKDNLIVALQGSNITRFNTATDYPSGRLSGSTSETILSLNPARTPGNIILTQLQYNFPIGDKLRVFLDAFNSRRALSAPISLLTSRSTGFVSYYARSSPMTAPTNLQSGIGVKWNVSPWLSIDLSAGSELGSPNNPSIGLFEGGYGFSVRPAITLGRLKMTAYYIHTYSPASGIDTFSGSNAAKVIGAGPVVANTYVGAIFYRITPTIEIGGSVAHSSARALGSNTRGDAKVWEYDLDLTFYDLGKKGNAAGLIFGMQPRLAGTSNRALAAAIGLPDGQRKDRNVGFHIEAFYAHKLTDNITITPALIWLTAPNHDRRNPDVFIGVIRTTFDF